MNYSVNEWGQIEVKGIDENGEEYTIVFGIKTLPPFPTHEDIQQKIQEIKNSWQS